MKYRAPRSRSWTELPLDEAMRMVADRMWETRQRTFHRDGGAARPRIDSGLDRYPDALDILPGYLPMPKHSTEDAGDLAAWIKMNKSPKG